LLPTRKPSPDSNPFEIKAGRRHELVAPIVTVSNAKWDLMVGLTVVRGIGSFHDSLDAPGKSKDAAMVTLPAQTVFESLDLHLP
jgi:hypothetical protein